MTFNVFVQIINFEFVRQLHFATKKIKEWKGAKTEKATSVDMASQLIYL